MEIFLTCHTRSSSCHLAQEFSTIVHESQWENCLVSWYILRAHFYSLQPRHIKLAYCFINGQRRQQSIPNQIQNQWRVKTLTLSCWQTKTTEVNWRYPLILVRERSIWWCGRSQLDHSQPHWSKHIPLLFLIYQTSASNRWPGHPIKVSQLFTYLCTTSCVHTSLTHQERWWNFDVLYTFSHKRLLWTSSFTMSPISLFEMAPEGSGELVLLESGLSVLSAIAGTVKVVVLISGTASKSESTVTFEVVERDTIGSGACSLCVIDLTPVASQKDFSSPLLSTLCNLLSISSAMFVHFDVEDNNKNISSLFFFNALLEHFDNNVSVLQQAVLLPPLYYYTLGQGLNAKASKRAVDKMLLTEKGFSEEIGKRNCTRNILSSLSNHKELIQLHDHEGSIITHSSVTDRSYFTYTEAHIRTHVLPSLPLLNVN